VYDIDIASVESVSVRAGIRIYQLHLSMCVVESVSVRCSHMKSVVGGYVYQHDSSILRVSVELWLVSVGGLQNYLQNYLQNFGSTDTCMESIYLMSICDSGLVWITVHIGPGLCIIATMTCDTFFRILGVAYEGERVAWILLVCIPGVCWVPSIY